MVRRTLPPPEWLEREGPRSAASLAIERFELDAPVPRRTGPRAELVSLRARFAAASSSGDAEAERQAAVALARALATRGTELELATKLGRRALLLGDDPALREELAGWFANLGEPALAAATLAPMTEGRNGAQRSTLLVRVAVLQARAGEAHAAVHALEEAIAVHPADPVAHELLASIAAWSPDAVSRQRASEAYLAASERREALAERAAAFENLVRAFEIDPGHVAAVEKLVAALEHRGRRGARDEALREHGKALGAAGRAVHLKRLQSALAEDDLALALGAAFDARLDAELDLHGVLAAIDSVDGVDESAQLGLDGLLARAGLHELLAARVELACDMLAGRERARARSALGRLYATTLARPERAVEAWLDAVVSDPGNHEAREALRRHAETTRDHSALVEALVRAGSIGAQGSADDRNDCLRELIELGEEKLDEPALSLWAAERATLMAGADHALDETIERLEHKVREQDAKLASERALLERASGSDRIEPLSRVAAMLSGRPEQAEEYRDVLLELCKLLPEDRSYQVAAERVLARLGRLDELESLLAFAAGRSASHAERSRARLALSSYKRRRGDSAEALRELVPLLDESGTHAAAWSTALSIAAQLEDTGVRARALLRLSAGLVPSLRATLTAVAAESLLEVGDVERARIASEQACHADPSLARPVAARAAVGLVTRDRWAADALERAMGVVVPRAAICAALSAVYADIGEPLLAMAWSQRRVALCPGDLDAARERLQRAVALGDGARLADTLAWLLSQPQPLTKLADAIAAALELLAALVPGRASALARRALDVLGARFDYLRNSVLAVADKVGERGLGIAALERWMATGAFEGSRALLLLDLGRRRRASGDADGAARALLRAIREGAPAAETLAEIEAALPTRSSDGELALQEARAETLSALAEADRHGTARAWRELGGALLDLSGDREGALRAWERAVALDSERGVENFAADVVAFIGFDAAFDRLLELAGKQEDPQEKARCLAVAASVALGSGRLKEAFDVSVSALELDPSRADVLAVAERSATDEDVDALEQVYDRLALAALGCYGERAVHYRAARQLERRGQAARALRHAVEAFEAVPSEGVVFITMARLADRSGERSEVVRAIERVALSNQSTAARAAWLRRAALFTGPSEEGKRQRVDVLLRALSVRAEADLVRSLSRAMAELDSSVPDERDVLELRYRRAVTELLRKVDGPEGARIAIEVARGALSTFRSGRIAIDALTHAVASDGDIEEYELLFDDAAELARAEESQAFVAHVAALAGKRFASAGPQLLELAALIAEHRGDLPSRAELMVQAACKNPENLALVRRAEGAAQKLGDTRLLERVLEAVPVRDRVSALLELASAAEREGNVVQAADALGRALAIEELESEERASISERALAIYGLAGASDKLEALARDVVGRSDLPLALRITAARVLGETLAWRGEHAEVLTVWRGLLRREPDDAEILEETLAAAEQAADRELRVQILTRQVELVEAPATRLPKLRSLARLLEESGERDAALARWAAVLELDARDHEALSALERDAERRGDYEAVAALLARRAALAPLVEDVRRIRLRRAAVLDQRLGRPDEARAELEALLSAAGDHLAVLLTLAALDERLGASLRAAPLWLRASALATDPAEAAECARRSCECYLQGGDVEAASRVLENMPARLSGSRLLELSVNVERQRGRPRVLADALDELATRGEGTRERRARWLVEAARASLAAGDEARAQHRALRAAELEPSLAEAQLLARYLEYLERGVGSAEQARETVAALRALGEGLSPEDAELRAFLIAEALDVAATGVGAGVRELERAREALGLRPLVGLGLGERLAAGGYLLRALEGFDAALAGDLRRLRKREVVALRAAQAARLGGERERARAYFELALSDPQTKPLAEAALAAIREELEVERTPTITVEAAEASFDSDIPEARSSSIPPATLSAAPHLPQDAGRYSARQEQREEVVGYRSRVPTPPPVISTPLPVPHVPELAGPSRAPDEPDFASAGRYSVRPERPERSRSSRPPPPADEPPLSVLRAGAVDRLGATFSGGSHDETALHAALRNGSVEAGRELIEQLRNRSDRAHDLANVCRRVATLRPGDVESLKQLHEAARLDRDHVHVSALEHVLALADPTHFVSPEPPALSDIPEASESVRVMLFREFSSTVLEALSLVWEGAEHVFKRDTSAYGLTGLERVPLTAPTPLARVYGGAARALGMPRTPLFQRRSAGAVTVNLALLSPPAIVLSGEVREESPELRFHLGAMIAAALPQFVLLFGAPESQARSVLRGLSFAFGPPRPTPSSLGAVLNLAELLWESIPARLQRRLRELCDNPDALDYDAAMEQARVAVRRAGLFVAGDFHVAVREICADEGLDPERASVPGGLSDLCKSSPSLANLYGLAVSPEYAETRWRGTRSRQTGSYGV